MKVNNKKKYVYLVGSSRIGYTAHSYDKQIVKAYIKQFKKSNYQCKKVKLTPKLEQFLIDDNEIYYLTYAEDCLLTNGEESFMLESFHQFKIDTEYYLNSFIEKCYYLKLTDFERKQLSVFSRYIFNTIRKSEDSSYDNENDEFEIFNYKKVVKYFIKHVLDGR